MSAVTEDDPAIAAAAEALMQAFDSGRPIEPLTRTYRDLSVVDAYAIQRRLVSLHAERGRTAVGRKIGLTSRAIQEQLGVSAPDYGVVLGSYVFPNGAVLSLSEAHMIAPMLEAELAFVLDRPLQGPGVTPQDVRAATGTIVPVFELIDSRVANWEIALEDTVADNASCYGVVTSSECPIPDGTVLTTTSVTIERDGVTILSGEASAVMGDPAVAVAWLANELARFGESLSSDQLVLSGSFMAAAPLSPGQYRAVFSSPFPTVDLTMVE